MSKSFNLFTILALLAAMLGGAVTSTSARAAGVLFVKPTGSGNCFSWATACTLLGAIDNAVSGDQIWVMKGIHLPLIFSAPRTVSFPLKNGVAIYGGFAGSETQLDQRDPAVNVTILSGDIGAPKNPNDNSFHVVVGSNTNNTAILDGFTIRGGNANGPSFPDDRGGGMFNQSGSPMLRNVIFSNNSAGNGGGIFNSGGSPTLANVTFSHNSAANGGGMHNVNSSPTLINVTFSENSASIGGGILNNSGSSPKLTNVTFATNTAGSQGGGIYNNGSPTLANVTFSHNSAALGGGMFNGTGASPTLTNVTFSGNSAGTTGGGGMFNGTGASPTLINTIIANSTGGDCRGAHVAASSNNLIEDASNACELTNGANANIVGVDPKLVPLANNGGVTTTMALKPGSPARDSAKDAACPAKDQRGKPRPQGVHCDIGAFEAKPAPGDLDWTFSVDGQVTTTLSPSADYITSLALQADGKIVAAGTSNGNFALVRYDPNGTLDTTFSGDGRQVTNFGGVAIAYDVAVQPDGKIVAVGNKCSTGGAPPCDLALARYTPTGNLDPAFDGDGKVLRDIGAKDNGGTSLIVLGNGKILVGGYVTRADRDPALYRFNSNGSPDAAFSGDGVAMGNFGAGDYISDLVIQSDGKIVLAGFTADGSGNNNFAITRLNANGTADLAFGVNSKQKTNFGGDDTAYSLALAGGAIVVVGETCAATCSVAIARYTTTGDLDTTFSGDGKLAFKFAAGPLSSARTVIVVAGGKIVVAGAASGNFGLARLLPGGGFDPTFSGDGRVLIDFRGDDAANAIARQGNGRYVLGGFTSLGGDFALARVLP
jgi:uncharacterized delta-60 repeat protein